MFSCFHLLLLLFQHKHFAFINFALLMLLLFFMIILYIDTRLYLSSLNFSFFSCSHVLLLAHFFRSTSNQNVCLTSAACPGLFFLFFSVSMCVSYTIPLKFLSIFSYSFRQQICNKFYLLFRLCPLIRCFCT